jgi:hypothetical protein
MWDMLLGQAGLLRQHSLHGVVTLARTQPGRATMPAQLEKAAGAAKKTLQDVVERSVYSRGCPAITAAFWARRRAQPEVELALRQEGGEDVRRAAFATRGGLLKVRRGNALCCAVLPAAAPSARGTPPAGAAPAAPGAAPTPRPCTPSPHAGGGARVRRPGGALGAPAAR